jgi:hypothetical protein
MARFTLDARTVPTFDREKLPGERAAPYFLQAGELLEKPLTMLLKSGVIGEAFSHVVV